MRYDEYGNSSKGNGTKYNSGYESAGFESFNRDVCMHFANTACVNSVNSQLTGELSASVSDNCWGWSPQGTSSVSYSDVDGKISTLTSSIDALNSCANYVCAGADAVGKALNVVSRRLEKLSHWSDKLNLKNQFERGSRDLRSQLLTI